MLIWFDLLGFLVIAWIILQFESEDALDCVDSIFDLAVREERPTIVGWNGSKCVNPPLVHQPPDALEPSGNFLHGFRSPNFVLCNFHGKSGSSVRIILSF